MGKKNTIIFTFAGLAIIILVIAIALFRFFKSSSFQPSGSVGSTPSIETSGSYSSTSAPVPANAVAPNEGSSKASPDIAVPSIQTSAAPGSNASYRSFGITISNNTYSPSTIIVNQGDTVNLEITALDADYGFTQPDYGFNALIKKGKTQTIQFQALQSGKFTFFCGDCGGPAKGPVGYLIVTNQ